MNRLLFSFALTLISLVSFSQQNQFEWVYSGGGYGYQYGRNIQTDSAGNTYLLTNYWLKYSIEDTTLTSFGSGAVIAKYDTAFSLLWINQVTGGAELAFGGRELILDDSGNVVISGSFENELHADTININQGGELSWVAKYSNDGKLRWLETFGEPTSISTNIIDMVTDKEGNIYMTGQHDAYQWIWAGDTLDNPDWGFSAFLAAFTHDGKPKFLSGGVGTVNMAGLGIDIGPAGYLYFTGYFDDTATFGGLRKISRGGDDVFVGKYDTSGAEIWVTTAGYIAGDEGNAIAVDDSGNVFLTGYYTHSMITEDQLDTLGGTPGNKFFIWKLDSAGNHLWWKDGQGSGYSNTWDLELDSLGNAYIIGNFGNGDLVLDCFRLGTSSGNNTFLTKYSNDGRVKWARKISAQVTNWSAQLYVEPGGVMYLTGSFKDSIDFDGIKAYAASPDTNDLFVARLGTYCAITKDILLTDADSICPGEAFDTTLIAPFNNYLWGWNRGIEGKNYLFPQAGTYCLLATDSNGCLGLDEIEIKVEDVPKISLGADTVICQDSSFTLSVPLGFANYLWSDSTTAISTTFKLDSSGTIWVKVSGHNGCSSTDTMMVTIDVCTGVEDPISLLSVRPNPVRNVALLDLGNDFSSNAIIKVYALNGQQVLAMNAKSANPLLDMSELSPGIYTIHVVSGDRMWYSKVVKE